MIEFPGGLRRVRCRIGDRKPLFQHVVVGDPWLFVDAGIATTPTDYLYRAFDEMPAPSAAAIAVITHADVDHFGGIAKLRERFPALITAAHHADARLIDNHAILMSERYCLHAESGYAPVPQRQAELLERAGQAVAVDINLSGGEIFDLGDDQRWHVLHAPGHSSGHLILHDPQGHRAIVGDAVQGRGLVDLDGSPLTPPNYTDVDAYLTTVDLISSLRLEQLFTSHFEVMKGDAIADFLSQSKECAVTMGNMTLRLLNEQRTASLPELCRDVLAAIGIWPESSWTELVDSVVAHLRLQSASGLVVRTGSGTTTRFCSTDGRSARTVSK